MASGSHGDANLAWHDHRLATPTLRDGRNRCLIVGNDRILMAAKAVETLQHWFPRRARCRAIRVKGDRWEWADARAPQAFITKSGEGSTLYNADSALFNAFSGA